MLQNNLSLPIKRFHNMNVYPASQCHKGVPERLVFLETDPAIAKGSVCDRSEDYSAFSHFDVGNALYSEGSTYSWFSLSRKLNNGFQRVCWSDSLVDTGAGATGYCL